MIRRVLFLFCIFVLVQEYASSDTYRISVVEHVPTFKLGFVNRTEAIDIMTTNMNVYEQHMIEASNNQVQIILFPEDGLYGCDFFSKDQILPYLEPIPDVSPDSNPIYPYQDIHLNITSPILCRASLLANTYNIYLVLDMGEVKYCSSENDPHCPSDSRYQYNTLVAFDPNGQLLAKYHKSHLYYEPQFDQPPVPDVVYFDTSFGVRFGMLICFDAMFQEPQYSLWYDHGVRDFTFSTYWVNMPPLITGTQMQQARSLFFPGNFLASGIGLSWYTSGSGVYAFGDYLSTWYNPTDTPFEIMLTSDIPIITEVDTSPLIYISDEGQPPYSGDEVLEFTTILPSTGEQYTMKTTSTYLNCSATFTVQNNPDNQVIGLVAITGTYHNLFPSEICYLMVCNSLTDCTSNILRTQTILSSWEVSGSFSDYRTIVYPMFATDGVEIISNEHFIISEDYKSIKSAPNFTAPFFECCNL